VVGHIDGISLECGGIILTNSFLLVELLRLVDQFFRSSGLHLLEKFEKKEITDYSQAKSALLFRWWIKLSGSLLCG